jgi:uncharacterized protein YndB with AHSA1/START domain
VWRERATARRRRLAAAVVRAIHQLIDGRRQPPPPPQSTAEVAVSEIHIVTEYPHSIAKVWRALTDPRLIPLWTSTGQGGRPVGFTTAVGTRFQYIAKPAPGWRGVVDCEVLEAREPSLLRYSWQGDEGGEVTEVAYRLEPSGRGTRFTYDHTGLTGVGGFVMAQLLGRVRRKMLRVGLPAVLAELDEDGRLRAGSALAIEPSGA